MFRCGIFAFRVYESGTMVTDTIKCLCCGHDIFKIDTNGGDLSIEVMDYVICGVCVSERDIDYLRTFVNL